MSENKNVITDIPHRRLNKNEKTTAPTLFCFVDTETYQENGSDNRIYQILKLGVGYFIRLRATNKSIQPKILRFTDSVQFWARVDSFIKGKNTLHIIAHNILFDMTVLKFRENLTLMGYECRFVFENGTTFISKWQNCNKSIIILNNTNWFQGKLAEWGKKLGLLKLEVDLDNCTEDELFSYCDRDVEILYKLQIWYLDFLRQHNLGNWKWTLASQAFNAYRHRFMTHPIYIPQKSVENEMARKAYRGGRVECFYSGKASGETFYKLDVNSMYPYVMTENYYPTCIEGIVINPSLSQVRKGLTKYVAIGQFKVTPNAGVFPYRVNGKTCYPTGTFTTHLCTPEISLSVQNDWLIQCDKIVFYRRRKIFVSFVEYFYKERLKYQSQSDDLRQYILKKMMNSLYGKFGQMKYIDRIVGKLPPGTFRTSYYTNRTTGEKGIIRQVGKNIILSVRSGDAYNSFVAIAAHVAAYARVYLYNLIQKAGKRNVYYCDTDSLLVNQRGYDNLNQLLDSSRLGALKVEGMADNIEIFCAKHYIFGNVIKNKGISPNATINDDGSYHQEVWPKFNKIISQKEEQYYNYFIDKHLTNEIKSGIIEEDSFISPFTIGK